MAEFFQCIPMAVFDTADLTSDYQSLNTTGFSEAIKALKIYNASDTDITVSYDSQTDHDIFPATSTFILDIQANHEDNSAYGSGTLNGRKGQIIYGKGSVGTGNLYIVGYR